MNEQQVTFFVDDGSHSAGLNRDSATQINASKSADLSVIVEVFSVSGVPINLSGSVVTMTIKKRPTDTVFVLEVIGTSLDVPVGNLLRFEIPRSTWEYAQTGRYVYSILSLDGSGVPTQICPIRAVVLEA